MTLIVSMWILVVHGIEIVYVEKFFEALWQKFVSHMIV
jgi:hypothetical protein